MVLLINFPPQDQQRESILFEYLAFLSITQISSWQSKIMVDVTDLLCMIKGVAFGLKIKVFELNFVRTFTAVVEKDPDTALYVGYVPGF